MNLETFIYPGEPADGVPNVTPVVQVIQDNNIRIVKPEYLRINENGRVKTMTEKAFGVNGYTAVNALQLKNLTDEQWLVVSGAYGRGVSVMLKNQKLINQAVIEIVTSVQTIGFTGVELDIEQFSLFHAGDFNTYVSFVNMIAQKLHDLNLKIAIDLPCVDPSRKDVWKNSRFVNIVDKMVYMCYDGQYDGDLAIASPSLVANSISWMKTDLGSQFAEKACLGVPSYAYSKFQGNITILTRQQLINILNSLNVDLIGLDDPRDSNDPLFTTLGSEKMFKANNVTYVTTTVASMNYIKNLFSQNGGNKLAVWHCAGSNPWFST